MTRDSRAFQYYTLFSYFPRSAKGLAAAYAAVLAIYGFVAFLTSFKITIPLLYGAIGAVYILATRVAVPYFDMEKSVGLAVASITIGLPAELACDVFGLYGISFSALPFLTTLVAKGILRNAKRFVVCVAAAAFSQLAFYAIHVCNIVGLLFRELIVAGSTAYSMYILKKLQNMNIGNDVDVLALANAWAKFILVRDPSDLETLFDRCGHDIEVTTRVLTFVRKDGKKVAIVIPGVHFGPFRELGSSPLPHVLDEKLKSIGIEPLVLHGAGSHELDIVTADLSRDFADKLSKDLSKDFGKKIELFEPFRVSDGMKEALVIPSSDLYVIAISSPITGGDDLPAEVQSLAEDVASKYLGVDVAIVDCHNLEGPRERQAEAFLRLLREALSRTSKQCKTLKVSIAVEEVKGHVKGLCSPRIKVLGIECGDRKVGLVYIFGNNADVGVRERLRKVLIDHGFDDAEVMTADDHLCTAATFDAPYYVVGMSQPLVEAVSRAAKKAMKDLVSAEAWYRKIVMKTRVLGMNAFNLLRIAERVGDVMLGNIKLWTIAFNCIGVVYALLRAVHLL